MNWFRLVCVSAAAALGGLLFGFDTGVINGAQFYFTEYFELNAAEKGFVVSSALLGCLVGALVAGPLSSRFGRRWSLRWAGFLFLLSAYGSGLPEWMPESVALLVFFRFVGGLAIGMASMNAPLYIAELAPAKNRGVLVTIYQLAIVIGFFTVFLTTYVIGNGLTEAENIATGWRWMFWSEVVPASAFLVLMYTVPRSPRWLVLQGQTDEAITTLQQLHGAENQDEMLLEIQKSIALYPDASTSSPWGRSWRWVLVLGVSLSVLQQTTGINAVLYYGADIFEQALGYGKDEVLKQQLLLAGVNLLFTLLAMYTVDRMGRKPLILWGSVGMFSGFGMLAITLMTQQVGFLSLLGVLIFIGSFAMSMGPVTWVLLSEMFPNRIRSGAMSIAVAAQWAANFAVSQAFPVIAESPSNQISPWHGALPYWLFMGFIGFLIYFIWRYIPETKGKSLEELESTFVPSD
jgi:SP family xylose:H+ symportor-like MFS transporter